MNFKKYFWILPLSLAILYFLAQKNAIPFIIYLALALPFATYMFPIKILIQKVELITTKQKVISIIGSFINMLVVVFTIMSLQYAGLASNLKLIIVFQFALMLYQMVTSKNRADAINEASFLFLAAGMNAV